MRDHNGDSWEEYNPMSNVLVGVTYFDSPAYLIPPIVVTLFVYEIAACKTHTRSCDYVRSEESHCCDRGLPCSGAAEL